MRSVAFSHPEAPFTYLISRGPEKQTDRLLGRWLHSSHHLKDSTESPILTLTRLAGFVDSKKVMDRPMLFGLRQIRYYQASVSTATGQAAF